MRVVDFIDQGWWIAWVVSAVGSLLSLKRWDQRLWFFILAPVIYFVLGIIVGALVAVVTSIAGMELSHNVLMGLTVTLTFGFYVLHCMMYRHDGKNGLRPVSTMREVKSPNYIPPTAAQKRLWLP